MWEEDYAQKLETHCGTAAPVCFWDEGSRTRTRLHVEDSVVAGPTEGVGRVKRLVKKWCGFRVGAVLGPDADDDDGIVVLGQAVRRGNEGVNLEADERHCVKKETGIDPGSNDVAPLVVLEDTGEGDIEEKLSSSESSRYRAVADPGVDRPNLQVAVKEACWRKSVPDAAQRIARYPQRVRRFGLGPLPPQPEQDQRRCAHG